MIRKSTRWDRKERVNVESDLLFNDLAVTTRAATFQSDSRFNFGAGDWSIGFLIEETSASAFEYVFRLGVTQMQVFSLINTFRFQYAPDGGSLVTPAGFSKSNIGFLINNKNYLIFQKEGLDLVLYANAKEKDRRTNQFDILDEFNLSGISGVAGYGSFAFRGKVSNFQIFNKAITQQEISYIYTQGGLIPESSHESCVAHYPLTQRQYFKASADFIIKHPQFALNDLIALDVVEQYNYSKLTALTANHGELINFTDAEVGADNLGETTAIKEFYNKEVLNPFAVTFDGTNHIRNGALPTTFNLGSTVTFFVDCILPASGTIFDFVQTDFGFRMSRGATSRVQLLIYEASSGVPSVTLTQNTGIWNFDLENEKRFKCVFEYDFATSRFKMYWNNIDVTSTGIANTLSGLSFVINKAYFGANYVASSLASGRGGVKSVYIYNSLTTSKERRKFFFQDKKPLSSVYNVDFTKRNNTVQSDSLGNDLDFINFDTSKYNNYFIESNSLLPEIKQALKFNELVDGYLTVPNFLETATYKKHVFIIGCTINDINSIQSLYDFSGLLGPTAREIARIASGQYYFKPFKQSGGEQLVNIGNETLNTPQFLIFNKQNGKIQHNGNSLFDSLSTSDANFNISDLEMLGYPGFSISFLGNVFFIAWVEDSMTDKEIFELCNNTLTAKQSALNSKCRALYNFNEGSFSEDGANVLLKDYSGNDHDAIVTGLTGATSADKLLDVPNHLVDINELR